MMPVLKKSVMLLIGALCLAWTASPAMPPENQGSSFEIRSISFNGNSAFSNSELRDRLQSRETPGFIGKTMHGWFESLGRANEYLDHFILGEDLSRIRQFYKDHGFQQVKVDSVISYDRDKFSAEIEINIAEGYRSVIDTLEYRGIINVPEQVFEAQQAAAKIEKGDHYDKALLEEELKRIIVILNNEGYAKAAFVRESSWAHYYTSTGNYSVVLTFATNRRYRFGQIDIINELDSTRKDIDSVDVLRQMDYVPGNIYSTDALKSSERNLNRTGIFDLARVTVQVPAQQSDSINVDSRVRLRPKDKHEFAPEVSLSDENLNFNLGVGLGYSNRNFLGGLRTSSARVRFRTATLGEFPDFFKLETDAIANVDVTFELLQPYVFTNNIRGSWSLSYIRDKQKLYLSTIFQNKFGFSQRVAEFTTAYLELTQQYIQLDRRLNIVIDSTNGETLRQLRDIAAQKEQFNSIISFTIQRDMTNDIFSPSKGFIHALTVEESGLLPLALRDLGWVKRPFTQFYRVNVIGRWYSDLTNDRRFSIFALKLRAGFEEKYGESHSDTARAIPQTNRFYAGGGGSIRGWSSRDLSSTGNPQFGGNVLFEGSMEIRTNLFQSLKDNLFDKLWTVLFFDFGTVWPEARNVQLRTVAMAAGFGIRYDTFFGPFRIDYGFRVYNPNGDDAGRQWITQRRFFGQTLREGVIHFGIGNAF
ncbi:MAG: BamA/TamA family outer membrane protein [bacterium]